MFSVFVYMMILCDYLSLFIYIIVVDLLFETVHSVLLTVDLHFVYYLQFVYAVNTRLLYFVFFASCRTSTADVLQGGGCDSAEELPTGPEGTRTSADQRGAGGPSDESAGAEAVERFLHGELYFGWRPT